MREAKGPLRLEVTTTGAWKLIAEFDGSAADTRIDVLACAARLVDALAPAGTSNVELRVVTADAQRKPLTHFNYRRGWWPVQPKDLTP